MEFCAFEQYKIKKPSLLNLSQRNLHRVLFDEIEEVVLSEAVDIAAVAVVALRTLSPVTEPAIRNPLLNLVVIFTEALFQVAHCVSVAYSS